MSALYLFFRGFLVGMLWMQFFGWIVGGITQLLFLVAAIYYLYSLFKPGGTVIEFMAGFYDQFMAIVNSLAGALYFLLGLLFLILPAVQLSLWLILSAGLFYLFYEIFTIGWGLNGALFGTPPPLN